MSTIAQKAKAIFLEAVEKHSPEEWPKFLDRACAGDKELRQQVEGLLQAHQKKDSLFDVEPTIDVEPASEVVGTKIGKYKVLQKIDEGGMGTVFMAEQTEPVRLRVALKVIKAGMDSKQVIARFEAERQALAMMDHPNIAKILNAGTTDGGRPYFVMELVKGIPITTYCDQHHLTPRERLRLFASVCRAVQHAHQKGVIHRDLKPSNVLVANYDDQPVVKVIDFGVAKATGGQLTEKTLFTQFGQVVGTLEYMSPEQARFNQRDIDTRSDIYSLGVLLYELLTGLKPFDRERLKSAALDEVMRIIREEEPPKPSTRVSVAKSDSSTSIDRCSTQPGKLFSILRGDLDWLVMKALSKERDRRYETASGMAADIERYLDGDAIEARPPSSIYRLRKTVARHRVALTTTAIVMLALMVGTALSIWQWRVAVLEREIAEQNLANLQRSVFQRVFYDLLNGAVDIELNTEASSFLTEPQRNALLGLRAFYDSRYKDAIAYLCKSEENTSTLAVKSWAYIAIADEEGVVDTVARMKTLRCVTAEDHLMLAQLYSWLRPNEALCHIEQAQHGKDGDLIVQVIRAIALANRGLLENDFNTVQGAAKVFEAARILCPDNRFVREHSIFISFAVSLAARRGGRDDLAEEYFSRATDASDQWGLRSNVPSFHLPPMLADQGRYPEALNAFESTLKTPNHLSDCYAATASLAGEQSRALAFLNRMPTASYYRQIGVALLLAQNPDRQGAVKDLVRGILAKKHDSDACTWALEALLMARVSSEEVACLAKRLLENGDVVDFLIPMDVLRSLAEPTTPDSTWLEKVEEPRARYHIQFAIGLRHYADNRLEEAAKWFSAVQERGPVAYEHLWAEFLLQQIRSDLETSQPK